MEENKSVLKKMRANLRKHNEIGKDKNWIKKVNKVKSISKSI